MFCGQCGKGVPDDAIFCPYCREPIQSGQNDENQFSWEYCEIVFDYEKPSLFGAEVWFWASAIGTRGKYCAGSSPHYKILYADSLPVGRTQNEGTKASNAHAILIEQLLKECWEPTAALGELWWRQKFRRKVSQ